MSTNIDIYRGREKRGLLYTFGSFALWGVLPVYWKLLQHVPPVEILAHRIVWSLIFTAALVLTLRKRDELRSLAARRNRLYLLGAAVLICANWGLYIHAVNSDHILESSLGYYITPLLNVLLGLIFLGERLNRGQIAALVLALIGVGVRTWQYGRMPWLSLALAATFAFYGLLKKLANLDGIVGLLGETATLAPAALGFLLFQSARGAGSFTASPATTLLLAGAGAVTSVPLLLFAEGARRVPLATVGFAQYLSPSLSLILGVAIYGEPFASWDIASFGCVWCALGIYTLSQWRRAGRAGSLAAGV